MNEYIFYTDEGYTEGPNEDLPVENCQMLGCVMADNKFHSNAFALSRCYNYIIIRIFFITKFYITTIMTMTAIDNNRTYIIF